MVVRSNIIRYFLEEYFENKILSLTKLTGFRKSQIDSWLSGSTQPTKATIEYIFNKIFIPEFKIIVEFAKFDSHKSIYPQLSAMLKKHGEHENNSGLYAFYDPMGTLIYLGKASSSLLNEMYSAIRRPIDTTFITFPKGVKSKPNKRYELVRYISAYEVKTIDSMDYPKHVESLVLRVSKPLLNKNIGNLKKAYSKPPD
jgi:hypothetical protein